MRCDLLFRVDGDVDIGFGHVVRSITLANAMRRKGYRISFFSLCLPGIETIQSAGYDVVGADRQEEFLLAVQRIKPAAVVFDLNDVLYSPEFLLQIKKNGPILVLMDDQTEKRTIADIVIDPTIGPGMGDFPCSSDAVYCLGPQYAILREEFGEFQKKHRVVKNHIEEVFVCFGGGDNNGLTFVALELIQGLKDSVKCTVVLGPAFPYYEALKKRIKKLKSVTVFQSPSNVIELMSRADVAIVHFGMLLYETVSLGLPVFLLNPTPLHDSVSNEFSQAFAQDMVFNLGHYQNVQSDRLQEVWDFIGDRRVREKIALRGQALVDGKGAERVADIIEKKWRR